jgi:hemolysin D
MEQTLISKSQKFDAKLQLDHSYKAIVKKLNFQNTSSKFSELYRSTLMKKVLEYSENIKSFDSKLNKAQKDYDSSKELLDFAKKQTKIKAQLTSLRKELYSSQVGTLTDISKKQTEIKAQLSTVRKDLYDRKIGTLLEYLSAKDALLSAEKSQFNSKNAITKLELEYLSAKDALLNAQKAQFNSKTAIAKLGSEIIIQTADRQAFIANWAAKLTSDITVQNEELIQLKQEKIKLSRLVDNIIVKSPSEGIVLDIPAVSSGGNVREGEPIVTLVQSNQPLFLEVDIDPRKITDVKLGMNVSIKLDSMPFQEFGSLDGELIYFSNDTFNESLSGDKGVFYRGRVKVGSLKGTKMPSDFVLSQGMLATADILAGKRPLISYFTYPITKAFEESFNEPE